MLSQRGGNVRNDAPLAVRRFSKKRRYFRGDIPETPVSVLIFGKNSILRVDTFATCLQELGCVIFTKLVQNTNDMMAVTVNLFHYFYGPVFL